MLPKYRSHKVVEASRITGIEPTDPGAPEEGNTCVLTLEHGKVTVPLGYMRKHGPAVGGYYVKYPDGYESYSPAAPFEAGYLPVTNVGTADDVLR